MSGNILDAARHGRKKGGRLSAGLDRQACRRWLGRASVLFMVCGVAVLLRLGPFDASSKTVQLIDSSGNDSGWLAIIDSSLDLLVDVNALAVDLDEGVVFIQKSAEFTLPAVNGVFPTIPITFMQTSANAVQNIVIDDEIILNNTGQPWGGFRMTLFNAFAGKAVYDPAASATSGGPPPIGFSVDPFTQAQFVPGIPVPTILDISGGTVLDGDFWFPGNGAFDGQLWIRIQPNGGNFFTLKETPKAVPLPASAWMGFALLGAGAVIGVVRRQLR